MSSILGNCRIVEHLKRQKERVSFKGAKHREREKEKERGDFGRENVKREKKCVVNRLQLRIL